MKSTLLQIDLQNVFDSTKSKNERLDFEKIYYYFISRDNEYLTRSIIYMLRNTEFNSKSFEDKLHNIGYEVKAVDIVSPRVMNTSQKVQITIDALNYINLYDKLILLSGDGDFIPLCQFLKEKNKKLEIWGFKETYDSRLELYADQMNIFDSHFFYRKPQVSVFGFNWRSPE